jgi:two-component system, NarL family, response regulator
VDGATLVDTIKAVFAGLWPRGPGLLQRSEDGEGHPPLTPRELEVLKRLARGDDTDEIAVALGISPETARAHVKHILRKLDVSSRAQAVTLALQRGLVHLD